MDPATLAVVSLAGSVLSAGVGAVGAMSTAKANADSANYQAQVARNNQIIAQQNASRSAEAGGVQAQARDMKTRALVGSIEAGQGASGIDLGSGSSEEVRNSARQLGRFDASTVMDNALLTARSEEAQARNFGAQATLDTATARNATTAGTIGGFSSLLSGASSFADKWLRYQTTGVTGFGAP